MMIASITANAAHTIIQCHGLIAPIGVSMGPGIGDGTRHDRGGPKFIHANDSCGVAPGPVTPDHRRTRSAPVNPLRRTKDAGAGRG